MYQLNKLPRPFDSTKIQETKFKVIGLELKKLKPHWEKLEIWFIR